MKHCTSAECNTGRLVVVLPQQICGSCWQIKQCSCGVLAISKSQFFHKILLIQGAGDQHRDTKTGHIWHSEPQLLEEPPVLPGLELLLQQLVHLLRRVPTCMCRSEAACCSTTMHIIHQQQSSSCVQEAGAALTSRTSFRFVLLSTTSAVTMDLRSTSRV